MRSKLQAFTKARIVVDEDHRFVDNPPPSHAGVMELVDVPDSKSGA
jgi:hypothetical protein